MSQKEPMDKNLVVKSQIDEEGLVWHDAMAAPFSIHGLFYEDGAFRRLPEAVARSVSGGVHHWHDSCTGGRVRFRTDSPFVAIRMKGHYALNPCLMSLCGVAGFDIYADGQHVRVFRPPVDMQDGYASREKLREAKMQEIMLYFPTYAAVNRLEIGLQEGCRLEAAAPYPNEKPILFYGSSITQGAAASRPGNCYTNIVCRELGRDIWNLGFSGNAKGEPVMADYIAGLPMECFVYDYDHNALTVEHLEATHEPFFKTVRAAHPDIPILMLCRPQFVMNDNVSRRIEVIRRTYENAKAAGDNNVYLLTGPELMALSGPESHVDGTHPNDLGFFSMAQAVLKVLKPLF